MTKDERAAAIDAIGALVDDFTGSIHDLMMAAGFDAAHLRAIDWIELERAITDAIASAVGADYAQIGRHLLEGSAS